MDGGPLDPAAPDISTPTSAALLIRGGCARAWRRPWRSGVGRRERGRALGLARLYLRHTKGDLRGRYAISGIKTRLKIASVIRKESAHVLGGSLGGLCVGRRQRGRALGLARLYLRHTQSQVEVILGVDMLF